MSSSSTFVLLAKHDFHKLAAFVGQPALRIPFVLLVSAQNLHAGSEIRAFPKHRISDHAVWPNPDPAANSRLRVGKEGAKADSEVERATPQRHPVIRNSNTYCQLVQLRIARHKLYC